MPLGYHLLNTNLLIPICKLVLLVNLKHKLQLNSMCWIDFVNFCYQALSYRDLEGENRPISRCLSGLEMTTSYWQKGSTWHKIAVARTHDMYTHIAHMNFAIRKQVMKGNTQHSDQLRLDIGSREKFSLRQLITVNY
jgi:hypothetical protein